MWCFLLQAWSYLEHQCSYEEEISLKYGNEFSVGDFTSVNFGAASGAEVTRKTVKYKTGHCNQDLPRLTSLGAFLNTKKEV